MTGEAFSYDRSLSAANAPKGGKNCPNCANRVKAEPCFDEAGGDFWRCTATPVLPAYGGFHIRHDTGDGRHGGAPINLAMFDPRAGFTPKACPLFKESHHD